MEFTAECRIDRLARSHRPGAIPGPVALLAGIGILAALSAPGYRFAAETLTQLSTLAESGFTPETREESLEIATAIGHALIGTFLFSLAASALWLIVKDMSGFLRHAHLRGRPGADVNPAEGSGPMTVRIGQNAAEFSGQFVNASVDWAAVDTATRHGGDVVLTLANGASWRIKASEAPGGARAVLEAARAAIAAAGNPA